MKLPDYPDMYEGQEVEVAGSYHKIPVWERGAFPAWAAQLKGGITEKERAYLLRRLNRECAPAHGQKCPMCRYLLEEITQRIYRTPLRRDSHERRNET